MFPLATHAYWFKFSTIIIVYFMYVLYEIKFSWFHLVYRETKLIFYANNGNLIWSRINRLGKLNRLMRLLQQQQWNIIIINNDILKKMNTAHVNNRCNISYLVKKDKPGPVNHTSLILLIHVYWTKMFIFSFVNW